MKEARIQYRKLPGHRRGFIRGASVWQGPDHLLLVRSMRFREEYRRFYFKDVQAIAVAKAPRFHVSTRIVPLLIASPFLAGLSAALLVLKWPYVVGAAALCLAAWVIVSSQFSCRCRIYTAVSSEELPSVYRSWTARRFLAQVEPLIAAAQGAVESDWADRVASRWWEEGEGAGPASAPETRYGPEGPALPAAAGAVLGETTSIVGICFAVALLFSAAFDFLTLHGRPAWAHSLPLWFAGAKVAAATLVFFRFNGTRVSSQLRRIAIIELVVLGVLFYGNEIGAGISAQMSKSRTVRIETISMGNSPFIRGVEGFADAILGFSAVFALLRGERR